MKRVFCVMAIALASSGMVAQSEERLDGPSPVVNPDAYQLGPGDKVSIVVFGEEDLSVEVLVGDDGSIDYPFLDVVETEGLTVGQLESKITGGLKGPYLVDPDVTVSVIEYRNVYFLGQVRAPGGYPYQPGLTVDMGVALAGGFTERASRRKIFVVRGGDGGQQRDSERVGLTDKVFPGDVVTVREGIF